MITILVLVFACSCRPRDNQSAVLEAIPGEPVQTTISGIFVADIKGPDQTEEQARTHWRETCTRTEARIG